MPAYITHRIAGERVIGRLQGKVADKSAFYLGCQGPDMLFFRDFQPWRAPFKSKRIGLRMHGDRVRELFETALEYARENKDDEQLIAYITGFITHYAVDKNTHPFVYGKAGKNACTHNRIEYMWDSYAAKEHWDIEPQQFDVPSDIMSGEVGEGICGWYQAVVKEVYGKKIRTRVIPKAQKHFAKVKEKLNDLGLITRVLIKIIRVLSRFDIGAMIYPKRRSEEWFSREEYERMRGLLQKSVDEACDMIHCAIGYILGEVDALPEWFGDTDFSGGTEVYNLET